MQDMPHPHFRYWKRRFARLPAVAPILLTAVALLVTVIRESRRLWPYRDQYQLTELLGAADVVVVVSLIFHVPGGELYDRTTHRG